MLRLEPHLHRKHLAQVCQLRDIGASESEWTDAPCTVTASVAPTLQKGRAAYGTSSKPTDDANPRPTASHGPRDSL
jgi:hypothetical protein